MVADFTKKTTKELKRQGSNAFSLILQAEEEKYQFQNFGFHPTGFVNVLVPLNKELKERGLKPIPLTDKYCNQVTEDIETDPSTLAYYKNVRMFREEVKCVEGSVRNFKPDWMEFE